MTQEQLKALKDAKQAIIDFSNATRIDLDELPGSFRTACIHLAKIIIRFESEQK